MLGRNGNNGATMTEQTFQPTIMQMLRGAKWETCEAPDFIADGLYRLSETLGRRNPEAQAHGLFGGEWGYGQDFENDTFVMFPYWWNDCTCGFDERVADWFAAHPHGAECYQAQLAALRAIRDYTGPRRNDAALIGQGTAVNIGGGMTARVYAPRADTAVERAVREAARSEYDRAQEALCKSMGLPHPEGCECHCTCPRESASQVWLAANDHAADCKSTRPNFLHKPSGLAVHWYKYIGRQMSADREIDVITWEAVMAGCLASLGVVA